MVESSCDQTPPFLAMFLDPLTLLISYVAMLFTLGTLAAINCHRHMEISA